MTQVAVAPAERRGAGGIVGIIFGSGPFDRVEGIAGTVLAATLLGARLFLALPFWLAGQARLAQWEAQAFLFEYEHPLPLLSPMQAAWLTTACELLLPVLLALGLFGRFAAMGLGVMAATIFFVIGGTYAIAAEQVPWMAIGGLIFLVGPGRLSVDREIRRLLVH